MSFGKQQALARQGQGLVPNPDVSLYPLLCTFTFVVERHLGTNTRELAFYNFLSRFKMHQYGNTMGWDVPLLPRYRCPFQLMTDDDCTTTIPRLMASPHLPSIQGFDSCTSLFSHDLSKRR